ncbi:hypothetical protein ABPS01_06750 [Streptococcus sp. ZJ151]|uniref:hypothetical protein n=1 Tax=Streptococcus jiangjianxini TaxID=3161189 RepID=UPI0032EE35EE
MKTLNEVYGEHAEMPFISPKYEAELLRKPIAKRQMERTEEGFLPGHIILLWRIQFGTYTTKSPHHKYFYTTYGIDAQKELEDLISKSYVRINSAFESIKLVSAPIVKDFLKTKEVKGLSKMKRSDLDAALKQEFTEEELGGLFEERSYSLTQSGEDLLAKYPDIVAKHPQKKY